MNPGSRTYSPEFWTLLLSLCTVSICFYGIRAAAVFGLAAVTAVATDLFCLFLLGKPYQRSDLNHVAAALILALMMPATVPYSIVLLSTVFMSVLVIHVLGSRTNAIFPPAAAGYLFAVLCWEDEILYFPEPGKYLSLFGNSFAPGISLSCMFSHGTAHPEVFDLLIGTVRGPMGTGCLLLLGVGLVVLAMRQKIDLWAALGYLAGISLYVFFTGETSIPLLYTNMTLFAAIFLVGDPCAMPRKETVSFYAAIVTGLVNGWLACEKELEYAPVCAVILTAAIWHAANNAGKKAETPTGEEPNEAT